MAVARRTQLDSKIAQTRQGVESADIMQSYAEIRAPFAGIVTEKRVEPGQMATPGTPLVTLEQAGAYRLESPSRSRCSAACASARVLGNSRSRRPAGRVRACSEIVPAVDPFLTCISREGFPALHAYAPLGPVRPHARHPRFTPGHRGARWRDYTPRIARIGVRRRERRGAPADDHGGSA